MLLFDSNGKIAGVQLGVSVHGDAVDNGDFMTINKALRTYRRHQNVLRQGLLKSRESSSAKGASNLDRTQNFRPKGGGDGGRRLLGERR